MKYLYIIFLVAIGCSENRSYRLEGIASLDAQTRSVLADSVFQINARTLRPIVGEKGAYPVVIEWASELGAARVGHVVVTASSCHITLKNSLIGNPNLLKSVFVHEFGHCAGLQHEVNSGEIMSPDAVPWSNYSEAALNHFVHRLLWNAAIH